MEDKQMYILSNAICMIIYGYIKDTKPGDECDELDKKFKIPKMLRDIADKYQEDLDSIKYI